MKIILIVGEKNLCRSILLSEYLKKTLKEKGKSEIEVKSAGIMAMPDIPVENEVIEELKKLNINGKFCSRNLLKQDVIEANFIFTVNSKIKNAILNKFPEKQNFIFTIKEFAGEDEIDFIDEKITADETKALIDKCIEKIINL